MAAAAAPASKQWGVSPPISEALPTSTDTEKNSELIEELKRENNYEPPEDTKKRMATLSLLQKVTIEFVKEVSRDQRLPPNQIEQFGGKIYTFGSYRLGVYSPGSDIDTLAVAPKHIKRDDFFKYYPKTLRRMAGSHIGSMTPVPDAFVPIIKLVLNSIEIDLIFCSMETLSTIPKDLSLNDNKLLEGLDQQSIRAITGPRVTDEILSLVPEQKTFRTALRAIKLWAKRRAVYANIVGYPGGVAWAMLVARVCQLYPHAIGGTIVNKFFWIMKSWKWPTPVVLKDIESGGKEKVWNPSIYPGDKRNIMPIITPAYPSMCATYNISKSGKTVITRELDRGSQITNDIFDGKASWRKLFEKHSFFTKDHKYYLSVIASSHNAEAAKAWSGLVESKVRILVTQLEAQSDQISLARPFTKGFNRVHNCSTDEQIAEVKKGSMKYLERTKAVENTDPDLITNTGAGTPANPNESSSDGKFHTYSFYIGIDLTPQAQKNLNISQAIGFFRSTCQQWADYNPETHFLDAVPVKAYDLPDDLFSADENKPQKPAKKAVKPATKPLVRNFEKVDPDANGDVDAKRRKTTDGATPTATPPPAQAELHSKKPKVATGVTPTPTPPPAQVVNGMSVPV